MSFDIGEKVVCVDIADLDKTCFVEAEPLTVGRTYVVRGTHVDGTGIYLVGVFGEISLSGYEYGFRFARFRRLEAVKQAYQVSREARRGLRLDFSGREPDSSG